MPGSCKQRILGTILGGTAVSAGASLQDTWALLQTEVKNQREAQLLQLWAADAVQGSSRWRFVDCDAQPGLCKAPMDCDKPGAGRPAAHQPVARPGRHANPRSFCGLPYELAAAECAAGNLTGYADLLHRTQSKGGLLGKTTLDFDAQYCFLVGHCDNTVFNETTPIWEGEAMCQSKYGRRHNGPPWYEFSMSDLVKSMALSPLSGGMNIRFSVKSPVHINLNDKLAHNFAKLACAMGNYHCDTEYCKRRFCKVPYYQSKYALKRIVPTFDVPW